MIEKFSEGSAGAKSKPKKKTAVALAFAAAIGPANIAPEEQSAQDISSFPSEKLLHTQSVLPNTKYIHRPVQATVLSEQLRESNENANTLFAKSAEKEMKRMLSTIERSLFENESVDISLLQDALSIMGVKNIGQLLFDASFWMSSGSVSSDQLGNVMYTQQLKNGITAEWSLLEKGASKQETPYAVDLTFRDAENGEYVYIQANATGVTPTVTLNHEFASGFSKMSFTGGYGEDGDNRSFESLNQEVSTNESEDAVFSGEYVSDVHKPVGQETSDMYTLHSEMHYTYDPETDRYSFSGDIHYDSAGGELDFQDIDFRAMPSVWHDPETGNDYPAYRLSLSLPDGSVVEVQAYFNENGFVYIDSKGNRTDQVLDDQGQALPIPDSGMLSQVIVPIMNGSERVRDK